MEIDMTEWDITQEMNSKRISRAHKMYTQIVEWFIQTDFIESEIIIYSAIAEKTKHRALSAQKEESWDFAIDSVWAITYTFMHVLPFYKRKKKNLNLYDSFGYWMLS